VVERRASEILKDSPVIDELIELDTRAWRANLLSPATFGEVRGKLEQLRSNGAARADVAIDFQGLIKSGFVAFKSRASRRIGFESRELREQPSKLFLTQQISTSHLNHVIEKNLELARAAIASVGATESSSDSYEFPIAISSDDEKYVEALIENQPGQFAIINPGGGWPTKLWPPQRYAELGDWLWSECALASFVTYGPGEEALAQAVSSIVKSDHVRPAASTLKQFVALARRAALFVGGDTGPLHLAAASRTPIVGLYGPTSPERNGPFDPRDVTVGRDLWCRADCHRRSCWHWECMDIPVSDVRAAVLKRLANNEAKQSFVLPRFVVRPSGGSS
jgi:ADP-heptose:LPS heptosyltransferase